ncbi:MAG: hypothetical protein ABIP71_05880 [Verrucomicrobiota bacterium]
MIKSAISAFLILQVNEGFSQGFVNLGFESAVITPIPNDGYQRVQFAAALPGWTGRSGSNIESAALYNNLYLDSTGIGIHGTNSPYAPVISGKYSVYLQARWALNQPPLLAEASLSQTGLVPLDSQSLRFRGGGNNFYVSLNGQTLSLMPMGIDTTGFTFYGADVTMFSGNMCELRFTAAPTGQTYFDRASLYFDSISFSSQAVPEPTTMVMALIGAFLLNLSCGKKGYLKD